MTNDSCSRGKFITLEGIDGCGKSTQATLIVETLRHMGEHVLQLREPGGSQISEKIRQVLLDPQNTKMSVNCELLLYEAARTQLIDEIIEPALSSGISVVCDRFYDSTTAYQAYAGGLDLATCKAANMLAVGSCVPDVTVVFDLDVEEAVSRAALRCGEDPCDRMEAKGLEFQRRVADGYRHIAQDESQRVKLVDATGDIASVALRTIAVLEQALDIEFDRDALTMAYEDLI